MSDWQPIETAPKDGTVVIIADDSDVRVGFWDAEHDFAFPWRFMDSDEDNAVNGWMAGKHGPTHWMPLPPPPKTDPTP